MIKIKHQQPCDCDICYAQKKIVKDINKSLENMKVYLFPDEESRYHGIKLNYKTFKNLLNEIKIYIEVGCGKQCLVDGEKHLMCGDFSDKIGGEIFLCHDCLQSKEVTKSENSEVKK